MIIYTGPDATIARAQELGSRANTLRGAIRALASMPARQRAEAIQPIYWADNNPCQRGAAAVAEYRSRRLHRRAQEYLRAMGLRPRDENIRRARQAAETLQRKRTRPYRDAADRVMPRAYPAANCYEYDHKRKMAVCGVDCWIEYSRREKWYARATALVILDPDSGTYNAIRIPPDIARIDQALESLKPAEVRQAERFGKAVRRQGDMYFVPQRTWNLNELWGSRHDVEICLGRSGAWTSWDGGKLNGERVRIVHPHHPPLVLDSPHKVRQQLSVFGATHAHGD